MPEPPRPSPPAPAAEVREAERGPAARGVVAPWRLQAAGVALFLFIPLVLYLFVRHPAPIAASLAAGVVLMAGHRLVARPYMVRAIPRKCLWCNRVLAPPADAGAATLALAAGGERIAARCCAGHRAPAARFFLLAHRARLPLRLGIFVPLLVLLAALAAAAAGHPYDLPAATALFQLGVGLAVSAAAWGVFLVREPAAPAPLPVPFPLHNFYLLGVRLLLWIFRVVGAWWIVRGAAFFLRW